MAKKLTYEEVKSVFEQNSCKLISTEYKNNTTKLRFLCRCGEESEATYHTFQYAKGCKKCGFRKISKTKKRKIDDISRIYSEQGCTLLEEEYKGVNTPMRYICGCGNHAVKTLSAFKLSDKCPKCISDSAKETQKFSIEEVSVIFKNSGCELLSNKYEGIFFPLDYLCSCGRLHTKTLAAFKMSSECPKCYSKKRSGENNWKWNPTLTDDEREENKTRANLPEQRRWKKEVYKRDAYACVCCGSKKSNTLRAHHLDGYNWCVGRRTDISNGVTLCDTCHKDFHANYGYGNNTEQQFSEWVLNKRNQDAM